MEYQIQRVSEISRHAFRNLVVLWLTIVFLTLAAALLMSGGSAKANILPSKNISLLPPTLPSTAPIQERYLSYLHSQHTGISSLDSSSRVQRNAEP